MKKPTKILIITLSIVLLLVLFCPYRKSVALDGGSTFYSAGLYEVVKWNRYLLHSFWLIKGGCLYEKIFYLISYCFCDFCINKL